MKSKDDIKAIVKKKYGSIAEQGKLQKASSCCGSNAPDSDQVIDIMSEDYTRLQGYAPEADLGLGCGLPTQFAKISRGDTVVDLGSGAGNDCFVARHETGPEGRVIGIDFTPSMIAKARKNAQKLGFDNVEFHEGDIERIPLPDCTADVVVSNCVLNLVPDKPSVFEEIFRILKPGGHFSISDIVLRGELPDALRADAEMYAGCVAGAIQKGDYLQYVREAGFRQIELQKEKAIILPDDILAKYLSGEEVAGFTTGSKGIYSITVYAEKPGRP